MFLIVGSCERRPLVADRLCGRCRSTASPVGRFAVASASARWQQGGYMSGELLSQAGQVLRSTEGRCLGIRERACWLGAISGVAALLRFPVEDLEDMDSSDGE